MSAVEYSFEPEGILQEWEANGLVYFDWQRGDWNYTPKGKAEIIGNNERYTYAPSRQCKVEAEKRLERAKVAIPLLYKACLYALEDVTPKGDESQVEPGATKIILEKALEKARTGK